MSTRVVFTQGGKGGVAKTEVTLSLIAWYEQQGLQPALLDFDIENTNKSGLKNFYPQARKIDVHREGALDEFFDVCDQNANGLVVADLGAGAGEATYRWFDEAFNDAADFGISFTSIGVTTNEAGAVQSILKWADHLQDRVEYLIVLNEFREPGCDFIYWTAEPATKRFIEAFSPQIMIMGSRIQEFQAELRNRSATLQQVIDGTVDTPYFKLSKNLFRAKRYQRGMFEGFERASNILLPPH
ncbi:MinD-like ATPase involved in chromosome partitioning or flagellar assembly [Haloferula luteola]|uniref:MinD-like ATPase involved in chromosome partitioning or flagellar assembly n=1 Tax=Haloferula luteola TaxID=595692 RepID=A0A840V797_9BACT|nr:hypothetical protein [Haloferula luteola]MBB5353852.1 MinD-like ATPase involved in chromosome partitioning or flagellar assembly [Haloferula luteola]